MGLVEIAGTRGGKYHVDNSLLKFWHGKKGNLLAYLLKNNADRWFLVDGSERIGKTTFAIQQMGAIEPSVFENPEKMCSRICFSPEEFRKTVSEVKNGVVIFDEAFRGLSSRAALSKVNKLLIQTMMEVGQNNNIIFLVLPSFFMLDIYPAMLRGNYLFHIKTDRKSTLRKFVGYNKKDKNRLYQIGLKKGWNYTFETKMKGRFSKKFPGGEEFEKAYLKKKREALMTMEVDPKAVKEEEEKLVYKQRDIATGNYIEILKRHYKVSLNWIAQALTERGYPISKQRLAELHQYCKENDFLTDERGLMILDILKGEEKKKKVKEKFDRIRQEAIDRGEERVFASFEDDPDYNNALQGVKEPLLIEQGVESTTEGGQGTEEISKG